MELVVGGKQTVCPLTLNAIQERGFDIPTRCVEKESVDEDDGIWLCVIFAFDPLDDPGDTCTYDIAFFRPKIDRIHALDVSSTTWTNSPPPPKKKHRRNSFFACAVRSMY